jgi:hypothetical protein
MISNETLYGTNDVPQIPAEICNARIAILNNRLMEEASRHFMVQDNNLINTLTKAIKHWTQLRDNEEEN